MRGALQVTRLCLANTFPYHMRYADLELPTRGEFPHGLESPQYIKKMDKNLPWYFTHYRAMHIWPRDGDGWDDLNAEERHGDLHMYYTLAWWKLGGDIVDPNS